MKVSHLLHQLRRSSLIDIANKLNIDIEEKDKNSIVISINEKIEVSKRFLQSWKFTTLLSIIIFFVGIIFERATDISNSVVKKDIETSQKRLEDLFLKKYDKLGEIFTYGYVVQTYLDDGKRYEINYPGKWTGGFKYIELSKTKNNWILRFNSDQVFQGNIPLAISNYQIEWPISFTKTYELQGINTINFKGLSMGVILLKADRNNPIFAIGIYEVKNYAAYNSLLNKYY